MRYGRSMMCYICDRTDIQRQTTNEIPVCDFCRWCWNIYPPQPPEPQADLHEEITNPGFRFDELDWRVDTE